MTEYEKAMNKKAEVALWLLGITMLVLVVSIGFFLPNITHSLRAANTEHNDFARELESRTNILLTKIELCQELKQEGER